MITDESADAHTHPLAPRLFFRGKIFGGAFEHLLGSQEDPRFAAVDIELVKLVKQWAERKQAAPGQIALAWLLAQKPWIVPIPGTTQMAHMIQNVGATSVVFTPDELKELNASVSGIQVQGKRLPDGILALSDVEAPAKK